MVKPHNFRAFQEADNSHRQCMDQMHSAAKVQGDLGIRSVQVFQTIAELTEDDEIVGYGLDVQTRATSAWGEAIVWEVQSLDATALAMGVTRQALLDQMAAIPPTFPS
jgi:hypothetical protein